MQKRVSPSTIEPKNLSLLIFSMALWGLSFPVIKIALEVVDPLTLGLIRVLFGAVPLSIFILVNRGGSFMFEPLFKDPLPFIGIALTQFYLPLSAQNVGMTMMDPASAASLSSVIQATSPIFSIFLSSMYLGEYIGKVKGIGAGIALSGTLLLVTRGGIILGGTTFVGNLLMLASALFYAISGVLTKKALSKYDPLLIITIALILSTILFLPITLITEDITLLGSVSARVWMLMFFLGFVCNGVALLIWYKVLIKSQLSKQVLFSYLIPLFGTLFSFIFLGEIISIQAILAGLIIVIGITIAQYGR
ncbi:MAG: DMT family transporter [Thermoplasmata archaeon]